MATHAPSEGDIKRNVASLVGGIVIALGVAVLAYLFLGTFGFEGAAAAVAAIVVGMLAGSYVRLADL
jgi:hypothetical protein